MEAPLTRMQVLQRESFMDGATEAVEQYQRAVSGITLNGSECICGMDELSKKEVHEALKRAIVSGTTQWLCGMTEVVCSYGTAVDEREYVPHMDGDVRTSVRYGARLGISLLTDRCFPAKVYGLHTCEVFASAQMGFIKTSMHLFAAPDLVSNVCCKEEGRHMRVNPRVLL